eukprot:155420_1
MEGHNSPTIAYESGNENIAPPAYAIPQSTNNSPHLHHNEYIQYPQFIPRRQLISSPYTQQSQPDLNNNNYNQPLIHQQSIIPSPHQKIVIIPPHQSTISYPNIHKNNTNIIPNQYSQPQPPPHQDLLCLAFITFFFFPILGLLAMCKASEANRAYSRGDYELAEIYNRQCRRYMKWAILFCIIIVLFAIAMNIFIIT